jgi:hypothetical protein
VNTETEVTGWIFGAEEPTSPVSGMVWLFVMIHGPVKFNALKEHGIMVYPVSAKQYVSGAWEDKPIMIYQDGAWGDFTFYIFKSGSGKKVDLTPYKEESNCIVTIGTDTLELSWTGEAYCVGVFTTNKIDLTDYSYLKMEYTSATVGSDASWKTAFGVSNGNYAGATTAKALDVARKTVTKSTSLRTDTLDISSLSGSYYIGVYGSGKATISNLWLE